MAAPQLTPNATAAAQFLEHAFSGGDLDGLHHGLIEIAYCSHQGDKPNERWASQLFGTDEIDEAVDFAMEQNGAGCNVYFGPALRHPDHPRDKRGNKAAIIGTLLLWCEWDEPGAFEAAKEKFTFAKPTAGVITGVIPNKRAQAFWRVDQAIKHPDDIDSAVNGLCQALGGDPKVVHADCLMRLPGTVSWRKLNKPERVDELTRLEVGAADRPSVYPLEQITKLYPPHARNATGEGFAAPVVIQRASSLGLSGQIQDGREGYMRNTILACLIEFVGTNGAAPTAHELFDAAWPQYRANVDLSRPGRGQAEFELKCKYTVQRFNLGRIPGLPDLDAAVTAYSKKKTTPVNQQHSPHLPTDSLDDEPFQASSLRGEPPTRKWIIPDWLPHGYVTSLYGDGGTGKSLVAQQLAFAVATGSPWMNLPVTQGRVLAVFAEDDKDEIWRRQKAIEKAAGVVFHAADSGLDDLYLWPRVGFDNLLQIFEAKKLVSELTPFYEKLAQRIERIKPSLVVLDTVADIFGGEENVRAQVNHFIKATLGAFCVRYGCTVLMLAHPSLAGLSSGTGTGGSTAWNNSVRSRWYLTRPADEDSENHTADERVLSRMKANYAAAGKDQAIALCWSDGVFVLNESNRQVITKDRAQRILEEIDREWTAGNPFGAAVQSERPLIDWMMAQGLRRDVSAEWIRAWQTNGVIASKRVAGSSSRKLGLKVIKWDGFVRKTNSTEGE